ncbi:MAG TPA: S1/P1 nuclease [Daejeonella sp.]|nr:S1/P1 nuclease [Daejeonella sp.]
MRSILKRLCFIALLSYIPVQTMAWGMQGHRIVGEIADSYINQKTRKEIQKILGHESMAITSNWADFIKSDPEYNYLSTWHYANFADYLDYQALKTQMDQDTTVNIYNRIQFLTAQLKNKNLESGKKQMYLRLMIHLVGDLHQPMHMGRKEDSGGNGIKIFWFNQPTNLHRLWDEQLIESQQLSYTEYTKSINFATQAQIKKWQSDNLSVWAFESYEISRQLYTVKPEEKLSYRYIFDHIATVNDRLLKGGVRLAGLLNQIFS